jgi:hypothetical protein
MTFQRHITGFAERVIYLLRLERFFEDGDEDGHELEDVEPGGEMLNTTEQGNRVTYRDR